MVSKEIFGGPLTCKMKGRQSRKKLAPPFEVKDSMSRRLATRDLRKLSLQVGRKVAVSQRDGLRTACSPLIPTALH